MEQRAEGTGLDIVDSTRLEIDVERAGDVFARACLREEGRVTNIAPGTIKDTTVGLQVPRKTRSIPEGIEEMTKMTNAETVLDGVKLPCITSK